LIKQIKGKNSFLLNPFLFAFHLKRIRSFGFCAFTPDPSAKNPKQKYLLTEKGLKLRKKIN